MNKVLTSIFILLLASRVYAAPSNSISTPNTFTPNTVIQSSQMNSNFSEVSSKFNAHSHTDITQVGTITSGTWNATVVSEQYGGTGSDLSAAATGSLIRLNTTGSEAIPLGSANQVLTINSAGDGWSWAAAGAGAKDAITRGFEVICDDNTGRVIVNSGELYHGTTNVSTTTGTILTLSTAGDWWDGATKSYSGGAGWNYVGVSSTGAVVWLHTNAPNRADTSGNTQGTQYYWYDGRIYWRIIGAVRVNTSDARLKHFQDGDTIMWDIPVSVATASSSNAWSSAVSCSSAIPTISTRGIFGIGVVNGASPTAIWIRPNGSTWATDKENGLYHDATPTAGIGSWRTSVIDDSQQIQYYQSGTGTSVAVDVEGFRLSIRN